MGSSLLGQEPQLEADDIQGHVVRGFDTKFLSLLSLKLGGPVAAARSWLSSCADLFASLTDVHAYRLARSAGSASTSSQVLVNAAISRPMLEALGHEAAAIGDGFFNLPMGKLAGSLGDRMVSGAPVDYVFGRDWASTPDLLLLIGAMDQTALAQALDVWLNAANGAGFHELRRDDGAVLADNREHFGYRDGISQVGVRGVLKDGSPLTPRLLAPDDPLFDEYARPGQPLVWPGQFLFGYPQQSEQPLSPGPIAADGVSWLRNGSLLIYRRMRQDVPSFREFLAQEAQRVSGSGVHMTARQLGAAIVGRWEDGTPVQLNPDAPDPDLASDIFRVNHVEPQGAAEMKVLANVSPGELSSLSATSPVTRTIPACPPDAEGARCPLFAHIRKVNPRGRRTDRGEAARTLMFQMMRRGIPYGLPFEASSGTSAQEDRGLLFLAYQTSFLNQFRTLNNNWMNNAGAPERDDEGFDLLVGQNPLGEERFGKLRDGAGAARERVATLNRFVIATGGAFLFSPSRSFFRSL